MHPHHLAPLFATHDLESSRAFYCDHLGFRVRVRTEDFLELCSRSAPSVRLAFERPRPGEESRGEGWMYRIEVADVDAEYARLRGHGVEVEDPPHETGRDRALTLYDPGGVRLYLFTPGRTD